MKRLTYSIFESDLKNESLKLKYCLKVNGVKHTQFQNLMSGIKKAK